jgi:hypothetical protein
MRVAVENENYWQDELSSLAIECKRTNELNDKEELEALNATIKEVYYQDYRAAYDDDNNHIEIDESTSHSR